MSFLDSLDVVETQDNRLDSELDLGLKIAFSIDSSMTLKIILALTKFLVLFL